MGKREGSAKDPQEASPRELTRTTLNLLVLMALLGGACVSEPSVTGSSFQPDPRNDPIDHLEVDLDPYVDLESLSLEAEGGTLTVAWNVHGPVPSAREAGEQSLQYVLSIRTFDEQRQRIHPRYVVRVSLTAPGHPYGEGWTGRLVDVGSEDRAEHELPRPVAEGRVVKVEVPAQYLDGVGEAFLWKATAGVGGVQDEVPNDLRMNGWEVRRHARFPGTDTLGTLRQMLEQ